jgi:hypothetical protein
LMSSHPDYLSTVSFVWYAIWGVMILECSIKIGVKMRSVSFEIYLFILLILVLIVKCLSTQTSKIVLMLM